MRFNTPKSLIKNTRQRSSEIFIFYKKKKEKSQLTSGAVHKTRLLRTCENVTIINNKNTKKICYGSLQSHPSHHIRQAASTINRTRKEKLF